MEEAEMAKKPVLRVVKKVPAEKLDTEDLIRRFEFEIERRTAMALSTRYKKSKARQELFNRGENEKAIATISAYLGRTSFDEGYLYDAWERLRKEIIAANPDLNIQMRRPRLKKK